MRRHELWVNTTLYIPASVSLHRPFWLGHRKMLIVIDLLLIVVSTKDQVVAN